LNTFIALLRGINVANTQIRMSDLQNLFRNLGYSDVTTYIQSGNVIFRTSAGDTDRLSLDIGRRISDDLGLTVGVLLRSPSELARVLEDNPFIEQGAQPAKLHVTFLATHPAPDLEKAIDPSVGNPDQFHISGREVYLHCPEGYGRSKLLNSFWERRLRVAATTRNWNTVNRLYQLAGD